MPNLKISKIDRKLEMETSKGRVSKSLVHTTSTELKSSANCNEISSGKHSGKKISNGTGENNKFIDRVKSSVGRFDSIRSTNSSVNTPSDIQLTNSKDYCAKKYVNELGSKFKNYQSECHKDISINQQDSKPKSIENLTPRYSNHITSSGFQRENNQVINTQYSRDDNSSSSIYADGRKTLEQQSTQTKITPVNFPPLRAPQSIVNVRHPFLTEARTKYNEIIPSNGLKSKSTVNAMLQSSAKDLEPGRQTYHNFGTSTLNMTTNLSPYPRPDPFPQPTLASILFPDSGQFSQSASSYSTNQLNQFQTYDPASYHTSTPVISQFSENSLSFPQYDSTTFVQPSHYPAADLTSSQFQYQTPGVGQIQDSNMYIQGLQNPITMTDQYATPNYARTVRTELIHRLRRPPRFTK